MKQNSTKQQALIEKKKTIKYMKGIHKKNRGEA